MKPNGDIAVIERTASNQFLTSAMTANDVMAQVQLVQDVMSSVMKKDEHFGVIPGTKKPSLWKAGAEKLCLLFRLDAQFETAEHYDREHYTVRSKCTLYHIPTGQRVGSGEGLCSTKEKKYAYRKVWENNKEKLIPNEYLADVYNTILKMANKRALVAATLVSTAASDIFTQDVEDMPTVLIDSGGESKAAQVEEKPKKTYVLKKPQEGDDAEKVPASVTDAAEPNAAPAEQLEAVVLKAYSKEKFDKKGGKYRGVLLVHADNSEKWWNTYHGDTIANLPQMKGQAVHAKLEMKGEYPLCHKLEVMR